MWLVLALLVATSLAADSCDADAPIDMARTTWREGCDTEACVCAAMLLGKHTEAKAAIMSRQSRGESGLRIRSYANARADAATGILARIHPRYPRHLKSVPALLWGQTDEVLHLRVRWARYTTGEPMARRVEHVNVSLSSAGLYVSAESALGTTPAFFETTLTWLHPLARADGCADQEAGDQCAAWAAAGECEANAAFMAQRCQLSCGQCPESDAPVRAAWAVRRPRLPPSPSRLLGHRLVTPRPPPPPPPLRPHLLLPLQVTDGELIVEGRKAFAANWTRLLAAAKPANRILEMKEQARG